MKKFCESLKDHDIEIISFEKNKIPLTVKNTATFAEKKILKEDANDKKYY